MNENQKIVYKILKDNFKEVGLFGSIYKLIEFLEPYEVHEAWGNLSDTQELEVLLLSCKELGKEQTKNSGEELLEKMSDIKELLENGLYHPCSSEDSENCIQKALNLLNMLIKEESGAYE